MKNFRFLILALVLAILVPICSFGQAASLPFQLQWGEAVQGGQVMANDTHIVNKFDAAIASVSGSPAALAAHVASTGTAVHGLGTMSTQAANAVAITGGVASLTSAQVNGFSKLGDLSPKIKMVAYSMTLPSVVSSYSTALHGIADYTKITAITACVASASSSIPPEYSGGVNSRYSIYANGTTIYLMSTASSSAILNGVARVLITYVE